MSAVTNSVPNMVANELPDGEQPLDMLELRLHGQEQIDALGARIADMAPGTPRRADLLTFQARLLLYSGQLDDARTAFMAALEEGGRTVGDAMLGLLEVALRRGDDAEADRLTAELLALYRDGKLTRDDCVDVGETLENADRLKQAHRWFTMPLREANPDRLTAAALPLLQGRYSVRRALKLPIDAFDEATEVLHEEHGEGSLC